MGVLSALKDLAKSASEHEADEIRRQTLEQLPLTEELHDRQVAQVCGVIRSVTMPARTSVPVLQADVFDGSTAVTLVWIGRRRIAGIEPGALISAHGRVAMRPEGPTIFNPPYTLLPRR
ncbi:MAG: OB-fold nucleic acid binding domain-containing protein [Actinobacteria bacterium]|jgi:hypothetical protein|nr:OB-fold nucleic acid binding domain-containing protein [Actinomycetota bacterium]